MIRKQIYLRKGQDRAVKRAARAAGSSEAEIIRSALDRALEGTSRPASPDLLAWERALRFMRSLLARGSRKGRARRWSREDLYAERLDRHARRSG